jgi:hypothetical protein
VAWIALLELVVIVVVVLRVLARRSGSRGLCRGLWRQVTLTARAFAAPFATWWRDRRGVLLLARQIGEPRTYDVAVRAWAAARSAGARPWAAVVEGERVVVRLAATRAPVAEEPWSADPDDPLRWSATVDELPAVAAEPDALPVVLGLHAGGVVLVDLSALAPVVAVGGDPNAARDLLHAMTAQLGARLPASAVGVAHGVHPRFPGRPMEDLLADANVRVLVCAAPGAAPDLEHRLAGITAAGRRVLVLGDVRGRRSVLRPDGFGVLSALDAPGPVETGVLARAVARAVRSGQLVAPAPVSGEPAGPVGTAPAVAVPPAVEPRAVGGPVPAASAMVPPVPVEAPATAVAPVAGRSASALAAAAAGPPPAPAGSPSASPSAASEPTTSAAAAPPAAAAVPAPTPVLSPTPEPAGRPPAFASARAAAAAVPPSESSPDQPAATEPTRP